MKAVVVGTGVGALASALRLRSLGLDVEVLESCEDAGGRARTFHFHGHAFDAGPTVITAPWLFDELFALFNESRKSHIQFLPCDPWYRIHFGDGSSMDLTASVARQEAEIAKISSKDARRYRDYLAHSEALYKIGYEELGDADFSAPASMLRVIPALFKLGGYRSLWGHTGKYFQDDRIRQAFSLQTLLVGGNPLNTTAIYGLIHAMERRGGIWFAKGGTGKLVESLVSLAKRHGIQFTYNATVTNIRTNATGIATGVEYMHKDTPQIKACDLCVWGGDPIHAYNMLGAPRLSLTERIRVKTVQSSMGLFVLYFKTNKQYPHIAHHTIILSKRWHGLLRDVFGSTSLPEDPSLYLHRPAATDPDAVLEDGDLFYVLAPVPHLGNFSNWQDAAEDFKKRVISILEDTVLEELSSNISFAESVDPRYFKHTLHSHLGAGFSIAPLLHQSAWFRFHNRSDKVKNLYLCGAGVHPGGGLPGVITSAKVIEHMIMKDYDLKTTEPLLADLPLETVG
jgi:phytoene desaturase